MEPVRVGVIGVGVFGESHVLAYKSLPYVEVRAVCDANETRAQEIAARFHIPKFYTDYHQMLTESDLDAVNVCTPEDSHHDPTIAAIAAGKHVLVEKPIATRLEDARTMAAAAHAAGIFLMPGHILRFETRHALVKDMIDRGELGEIVSITTRRNRPKWLGKTYLRTPGVLETSIHDLDLLLWYIPSRIKRVHAIQRSVNQNPNPDATWALLEFENGAVAMLETLWLNPDNVGIGANDAMQVTGTRGIAHIDFVNAGLSVWGENGYLVPDISHEPRVRGEMFGALKEELAYFTRCVLENRAPAVVSLGDALHGLEVALAIIESAQSGHEVSLHPVRLRAEEKLSPMDDNSILDLEYSPSIHVEVFIAARLLERETNSFSPDDLKRRIRREFQDERPGIATHVTSVCVANAKLNHSMGYNYLWRVGHGEMRVFRPGKDKPVPERSNHRSEPKAGDVPAKYRYLLNEGGKGGSNELEL